MIKLLLLGIYYQVLSFKHRICLGSNHFEVDHNSTLNLVPGFQDSTCTLSLA